MVQGARLRVDLDDPPRPRSSLPCAEASDRKSQQARLTIRRLRSEWFSVRDGKNLAPLGFPARGASLRLGSRVIARANGPQLDERGRFGAAQGRFRRKSGGDRSTGNSGRPAKLYDPRRSGVAPGLSNQDSAQCAGRRLAGGPPAKRVAGQAKVELDRHSAGRRHRQAGTAERIADHPPFPEHTNGLRYNEFWKRVYDDARCRANLEQTRTGFIEWTERTDKPRTPQLFYNFCKGENERKGIP